MPRNNGKKSIRSRITAGFIGFMVFCLTLLCTSIFVKLTAINTRTYNDNIQTKIELIDASLQRFFQNVENTAMLLSTLDTISSPESDITSYIDKKDESGLNKMNPLEASPYEASVYALQKQFVQANPEFLGISLGVEKNGGFVRYPAEARQNGYDARARSWYKLAMSDTGKVNFTDAYTTSAGELVIVAAKTVFTPSGEVKGVVTIDVNLSELATTLDVVNAKENAFIILVDGKGNVLVHPRDKTLMFKKVTEIGIKNLESYASGDTLSFEEKLPDGKTYQIRTIPERGGKVGLNYIVCVPRSEFFRNSTDILRYLLISIILAVLLSIPFVSLISGSIIKPLEKITGILKNIAEGDGDLTVRLPILSGDEIGLLSGYFNETISKVSNSMKSVITQSDAMREVGEQLAANMTETASAINQISANLSSIKNEIVNQSTGVEETQSTIAEITRNIDKLNESIDSQAASVVQSSSSIEEMVANIRSVTQILGNNSTSVRELGEAAESGRVIVEHSVEMTMKITEDSEGLLEASEVIQNIANQTNLLAMNAAIEAAHAGEAGKGFAVVADEIRKLAEDSNSQGKTISDVLTKLKANIEEVSKGALEIQKHFSVIFTMTQTVSNQENVIKNAMDEQSSGGEQVLEAIRQINDITGEVKDGAAQMQRGSKEILVEMEKLAAVTREINDSMTEMSQGVSEINSAMQTANDVSVQNRESIKIVAGEIGKFKV